MLVCVFIHQPPWLLILNGSQVSHTRSPSLLNFNLLLIPKVISLTTVDERRVVGAEFLVVCLCMCMVIQRREGKC